ncbi:MAG: PQQ-binding-like beta-propeller repeat protein, partial [Verrucomicrobiota bacterium]|nr:PQQ-binding-like beta-propeller repeat protein [Verrucomicrobiota bacterium]
MNLFVLIIVVFSLFPAVAEDWPQYRGSQHNGSTGEEILSVWPGSGLKPSWRASTLNGFSSFAVAEGFAATQLTKDGNEALVVFSASTGDVKWTASLSKADFGHDGGNAGAKGNNGGDGPRSTPSIDKGNIFVFSADFELFCFNLETGKTVWRKSLLAEHKGSQIKWENAASPVVEGEMVIVGGGGPGQSLLAFQKESGRLIWKVGTETVTHATPTVARIHGVPQVIFFCVSGLVSVEIEAG